MGNIYILTKLLYICYIMYFLEIQEKAKRDFKKVVKFKPLSSKSDSKEIYIYCKGV